jgi:recA bacterial DNA recombination protein
VAAAPTIAPHAFPAHDGSGNLARGKPLSALQTVEFPGVFWGRELTRKDRRLGSTLPQLDGLITGGIARGRISEIVGRTSSGKTTLAASFAASATRRGETAAWIDLPSSFDPASVEAAGADLGRILWIGFGGERRSSGDGLDKRSRSMERRSLKNRKDPLRAAELILETGGFGLVVIDFGAMRYPLANGAALRLARAAERSAAAVLVLATRRMCGTFAALVLSLGRVRACFSRPEARAPALFDGLRIEVAVARNKLGTLGRHLVCDVSQCRAGTIAYAAEALDAAAVR